jgi:hypothetical protein
MAEMQIRVEQIDPDGLEEFVRRIVRDELEKQDQD